MPATVSQRLRRLAYVAGGALALAATGSCLYQAAGERRDCRRYPPPGRVVDGGDGLRHVLEDGSGAPTVVVITCLGGPAVNWVRVQRLVRQHTRVFLYDRAGLGWSAGHFKWRRSIGSMADELHSLLRAADVERPLVLAGHSIGGLVARLYAARYPDDVSGLVLVDSSHEDMNARLDAADPQRKQRLRRASTIKDRLRWLGLRRLRYDMDRLPDVREGHSRDVPPEFLDAAVALDLASRTRRADVAEMSGLKHGFEQVRTEAGHLAGLPLTVLTGGPHGVDRPRWWPTWCDLQEEMAAMSTATRHVVVEHTGHHVHRDDPEFVAAEIVSLVDRVRAREGRGRASAP